MEQNVTQRSKSNGRKQAMKLKSKTLITSCLQERMKVKSGHSEVNQMTQSQILVK